jgi:uncharacterized protein (TIGR02679 family)
MSTANDRLQRLLGGDHLAELRKRLRRRFERAAPDRAGDSFRISRLTPDEHAALAALTGRRPRFSGSLQIDLAGVDAALLQAGIAASLRAALEQLDGPIIHLATARDESRNLWSSVADSCRHPGLLLLLQAPAAMGLLKRLSDGDPFAAKELCHRAEAVLRRLPANGLTRAQLAADVLGDAHALDNGRAVATLVLAVCRQVAVPVEKQPVHGMIEPQDDDAMQKTLDGERARDVWARAGILVNELARPAAFLNLWPKDNENQVLGEPGYISLRRLLRRPPAWNVAGQTVFVCENPNLLAIAADNLGDRCPPMICTDGMPSAAQNALLRQSVQAGARLLYHGDFDWPGLHIGNYMMREFDARPWRFGAADYLAAVRAAPRPGHRLRGVEVLASWDEELTAVMTANQAGIAEEAVAAVLLEDLLSAFRSGGTGLGPILSCAQNV